MEIRGFSLLLLVTLLTGCLGSGSGVIVGNGIRADINGDGHVDLEDRSFIYSCIDRQAGLCPRADIDGNGQVNVVDLKSIRLTRLPNPDDVRDLNHDHKVDLSDFVIGWSLFLQCFNQKIETPECGFIDLNDSEFVEGADLTAFYADERFRAFQHPIRDAHSEEGTPVTSSASADLNGDGVVSKSDTDLLISLFEERSSGSSVRSASGCNTQADINGDCVVDKADLEGFYLAIYRDQVGTVEGDLNQDGQVDADDQTFLLVCSGLSQRPSECGYADLNDDFQIDDRDWKILMDLF